MARVDLKLAPGTVTDDTPSAAEGRVISSNYMRWVLADGMSTPRLEIIGGWERFSNTQFMGIARGSTALTALTGDRVFAWGTSSKLYHAFGGDITDVTPLKAKGTLINPFTVRDGSNVVTVTWRVADSDSEDTNNPIVPHGLKDNDLWTVTEADAVGGITVSGTYPVKVIDLFTFTIEDGDTAASTVTTGGGGSVEFSVPLEAGLIDGTGGTGFGTGGMGLGAFGAMTSGDVHPRLWFLNPWGGNLLASYSKGGLFECQIASTYPQIVKNGGFANADEWTVGTNWAISGGAANATAATNAQKLEQRQLGTLRGGAVWELTIDVTVTSGALRFGQTSQAANSNTPTDFPIGAEIKKTGVYTRRFRAPPDPTKIFLSGGATAFTGSVNDISIKLSEQAYRITAAPPYNGVSFIDPRDFVVVLDTIMPDGTYTPLGVRWCDRRNVNVWIPTTTNLAGFDTLKSGSKIVGAVPARDQNLIWTDESLYGMVWNGAGFDFPHYGSGCGLKAPHAAAEINGTAYWMGSGEFWAFAGVAPQVIDCPIKGDIFDHIAHGQDYKCFAASIISKREIWFFYPDKRDGNEISRAAVYNWASNSWVTHRLARTTMIRDGIYENPIAFGADGYVYYHERGDTAHGEPLDWWFTTGRIDLGEGDTAMSINRFICDMQGQVGNALMTIKGYREARGPKSAQIGPLTMKPTTAKLDFRLSARQIELDFRGSPTSIARAGRFGRMVINPAQTANTRG